MYNRYIPQSDGSFERRRMEEKIEVPTTSPAVPIPEPPAPIPELAEAPLPPPPHANHKQPQRENVSGFLRQILPKDFDTGDLIVVLLLLLLAGDSEDDRNSALLTLALYLCL